MEWTTEEQAKNEMEVRAAIQRQLYYPGLFPWEPLITGFRDYCTAEHVADHGDMCEYCGKVLQEGQQIISGPIIACNWEHALEHAKKWPEFYHVEDI